MPIESIFPHTDSSLHCVVSVSVDNDSLMVAGIYQVLYHLIEQRLLLDWGPSVEEVARIFVNQGQDSNE